MRDGNTQYRLSDYILKWVGGDALLHIYITLITLHYTRFTLLSEIASQAAVFVFDFFFLKKKHFSTLHERIIRDLDIGASAVELGLGPLFR